MILRKFSTSSARLASGSSAASTCLRKMISTAPSAPMTLISAVGHGPADHLVHVVGLAIGLGHDVEQLLVAAVDRVGARNHRSALLAVLRHVGQVVLDRLDAGLVVGDLEVPHARLAGVYARAA